jgi:hypothetical protein
VNECGAISGFFDVVWVTQKIRFLVPKGVLDFEITMDTTPYHPLVGGACESVKLADGL